MNNNPKIYRIDKNNHRLVGIQSTKGIIEKIINYSSRRIGLDIVYEDDFLGTYNFDGLNYFLYSYIASDLVSEWKEFLPKSLTSGRNFTEQKLSLILFIESKFHLFCIIGGMSYKLIVPFIDHSFGLNTYSRIIKPEEDELTSLKSRGITGSIAGSKEQYRDNYKLINFIKFGKIPQEIHLKLSKEISNLHFKDFLNNLNDRIQVYVGKSFQIKKTVNFEGLHKLVKELITILELAESDYLSSYKEINDKEFIEKNLKPELINKLFIDSDFVVNGNPKNYRRFGFDLCNPNNIEQFYEADNYKLKEKTKKGGYKIFATVYSKNQIYEAVIKRAVEVTGGDDQFNFMVYLQGVLVTCYKNGKPTIKSSFLFHFSAEFQIAGQPYFLVDTKWYNLKDSFIQDLKVNTKHILKTYKASNKILPIDWDKTSYPKEGQYNMLYNELNGYIVVDTIIKEGFELCDIIYFDENNIFLIHVKYGFESRMRELANQITISAKRLKELLGTKDRLILGDIYDQVILKNRNVNGLSKEGFKALFDKKITYILAFSSHLRSNLLVEEHIEHYTSNIARFSLVQCSSEMRAYYYDMLIYQIPKKQ